MTKRCALYLRVSTDKQTTANQRVELERAAANRGWTVTNIYEDIGFSGAKNSDQRPGLKSMIKDARRGKFKVFMVWSMDRLSRSLKDLITIMDDMRSAGVDMFFYQQDIDATTATGTLMMQMIGAVAQFERSLIRDRVQLGMDRVRASGITKSGRPVGRPAISERKTEAIRQARLDGMSLSTIAQEHDVGRSTVHRIVQDNARLGTLGR